MKDIKLGEIVEVGYGIDFKSEPQGCKIWAIVLKIKDNRASVLPIYKSHKYLDDYSPIYLNKKDFKISS